MKKLKRLSAVIVFLVLAVALVTVIAGAEDAGSYKVVGKDGTVSYTDNWTEAVDGASDGGRIYLNKDITVTTALAPKNSTGDYVTTTFDLNGKTITNSTSTSSALFVLDPAPVSFSIVGEGTIKTTGNRPIVRVSSAIDDNRISLVFDGYGKGITVNLTSLISANGDACLFYLGDGANTTLRGDITVQPMTYSGIIFRVGDLNNRHSYLTLDGARLTVEAPWDSASRSYTINCGTFLQVSDNAHVRVKNHSVINVEQGNVFGFVGAAGNISGTITHNGAEITGIENCTNYIPISKWIDVDDSEIIANTTILRVPGDKSGAGYIFSLGNTAAEIRVDNSKLVSANRLIVATYSATDTFLTPSKVYFKNVDYTTSENIINTSVRLTYGRVNLIWDGGTIDLKSAGGSTALGSMTLYSDGTYYGALASNKLTVNDTCFGDEALAELRNQTGNQSISFDRATLAVTVSTAYRGGDGNVYENAADYSGTTTEIYKLVYSYSTVNAPIASNLIGSLSYKYSEVSYTVGETKYDEWYGIGFNNVCFVTSPRASAASPTITYAASYKAFGSTLTDKTVIKDGKAETYPTVFWDYTEKYHTDSVSTLTNVFNPTTEAEANNFWTATKENFAGFTATLGGKQYVLSENGSNGYLKFTSDATAAGYVETRLGGYGTGNTTGVTADATYPLTDYSYVIQEFDVRTDDGAYLATAATGSVFMLRYAKPTYKLNEAGTGFEVESVKTTTMQVQNRLFTFNSEGILTHGYTCVDTKGGVKLPTDGSWARFTIVYEINKQETSYIPVSGSELTLDAYDFSGTKAHIYLNGEWISSTKDLINGTVDKAYASTLGLDCIRFNFALPGDTEASTCFDNLRVTYLKSRDELNGLADDFKASLIGKDSFMIMPDNNSDYTVRTESPIASVDGKDYYTEDELAAAIEENSLVSLKASLANPLYSANKRFTVLTNGYTFKGIVSETNRIYESVLVSGMKYDAIPALDGEIYTVVYDDSDTTGFTDEGTKAALGSYIEIAEAALPENAGSKLDPETGDLYVIDYWTLDKNKEGSRLVITLSDVTDGKVTLVAVHRTSDEKATVIWCDADGNTVATDYYLPGNGVYATPNDGSLVPSTPMADGWYEIGFIGWNEDPASVELTDVATYVFTPKMGERISSTGVPGIKINLSVYTDFELNVFIPETIPEGIEGVVLSGTADGKTPVRPELAAGSTAYDPSSVTIGGVPYTRYIDSFAAADTSLKTYYLVFTVNDKTLVQTIEYGIPSYASQLMADKDASFEAKTLVMNIVNYADKLITLLGKDGGDGARIYTGLLEKYGTGTGYGYLSAYELLYDERFASEDNPETDGVSNDLYDGIASLTYKNAAGYIDSASILFTDSAPVFVFKYGPKAVSYAEGIKKPRNNTDFCVYNSVGVFTYFNYFGDSTAYPTAHHAYDGDIYNGTKYNWNDSVWLKDTVALVDGSGARYYYDPADSRYEDASGNAYTGNASDLFYDDDTSYYAVALSYYRYTSTSRDWQKVYDLVNPVNINVKGGYSYTDATGASKTAVEGLANVTYSLTAYIKGMIDAGESEYAELGKALYAYALAAHNFKNRVEEPNLGEPVAENTAETLSDGTELIAAENTVYSDKALRFYSELDSLGAGDEIYVGHAKLPSLDADGNYADGAYASSYVIITRSTIQLVNYYSKTNHNIAVTPGTPNAKPVIYNHGLYISDFIELYIEADNGTSSLILKTANGAFTKTDISWVGRQGKILAKPVGTSLSSVSVEWYCDALSEDLWFFGDSYFNYADPARWPYYMAQDGYSHNSCLAGFPGMGSAPAIRDFKWAVEELGYRPKVAVWAQGMNDSDGIGATAPNANWLRDTEEFIRVCNEYGITPVLCTIPNTPTIYNGAKNAWVKASGYRYVDTAAAVGSDVYDESLKGQDTGIEGAVSVNRTGYTWSEGYLNKDLVHPAAPGAEAIYKAFLQAVPEITGDYSNTNN